MDEPIQLLPSKWTRGNHPIWSVGCRSGSSNNNGPNGKRAKRFYPGRALRKALGKHGLNKQNRKNGR